MKSAGSLAMVFVSGGIAWGNLTYLKFGVPEHYDGSWGNVAMAVVLAVFFGCCALKGDK